MNISGKEVGFIVENVMSIVEVHETRISIVDEFNGCIENKFIKGNAILE